MWHNNVLQCGAVALWYSCIVLQLQCVAVAVCCSCCVLHCVSNDEFVIDFVNKLR